MDAVYLHGVRDVRIGRYRPPPPRAGEVLLKVGAVGICGSDLHYYLEGGIGPARIDTPFIPGHEFAAYTMEDMPALGLREGALVAVDPARPCGVCEWCHRGHHNLCPNVVFAGAPPYPGAMTGTIAATPAQIFPVPDGFTPTQAVMLEPLGVGVHAMDLARPHLQETVAVLGCGTIGLILVQLARLAGVAQVFAVDPVGYRADMAKALGADAVADRVEAIADLTGGRGVDLVLEATNAPAGFQHAAEAARIGGRVVLVGIPDGDAYTLSASMARRKGLSIKLSRRMGDVYPRAIALVAEGRVDVDRLVSHDFDLDGAVEAFRIQAAREDGALKSIIHPGGQPPASGVAGT
ncbi:MAG: zinc-dependent alcohol dehydrogenase [Inquilinaceae bacterium]